MKHPILLNGLIIILLIFLFSSAHSANLCTEPPSNSTIPPIGLEEIASGFLQPTYITHAGDGRGKLFVVEQGGTIRIIENGKVLPIPFLDIRNRVENSGEKGLLSVAFHPSYNENGLFYIEIYHMKTAAKSICFL